METEPTALYRFFDGDEKLLYVGISRDPKARWRQHRKQSAWSPQVALRVIEWHPSRTAALLAEIKAIKTERPRHNAQHRVRPKVRHSAVAKMLGEDYAALARVRREADKLAAQRERLHAAIVEADAVKVPKVHIAEAGDLSREWVRQIIEKAGAAAAERDE